MSDYHLNLRVTADGEELVRAELETDNIDVLILAGVTCLNTLADWEAADETPPD